MSKRRLASKWNNDKPSTVFIPVSDAVASIRKFMDIFEAGRRMGIREGENVAPLMGKKLKEFSTNELLSVTVFLTTEITDSGYMMDEVGGLMCSGLYMLREELKDRGEWNPKQEVRFV